MNYKEKPKSINKMAEHIYFKRKWTKGSNKRYRVPNRYKMKN